MLRYRDNKLKEQVLVKEEQKCHKFLAMLNFCLFFFIFIFAFPFVARAELRVDIYGPGQNLIKLAMAAPIDADFNPATSLGRELENIINENLQVLPFMRLISDNAIQGGNYCQGYQPPSLDVMRFQAAGSDLVLSMYWPDGDLEKSNRVVQIRAFETNAGNALFARSYRNVNKENLAQVADTFCADLLEVLIGSGDFFRSTLAFVKKFGKMQSNIWLCKPTGRDLKQVTRIAGEAMSPVWSPDGRYIVFAHFDAQSHSLGVWDREKNRTRRMRFPGNMVIGPSFMPDNKVAVALSNGRYPAIFLLDHKFAKERILEDSNAINVSPSFDSSGTRMAFTSSRLGGPQIFLKDFNTNTTSRVSMNGRYNTEPNISRDGTLVAYSRLTEHGHRIFVQDLESGLEKQITFGPGSDEQPSFCADSYFIAFTSTRKGGRNLYLTTRHGAPPRLIPTGKGEHSFPRWGIY